MPYQSLQRTLRILLRLLNQSTDLLELRNPCIPHGFEQLTHISQVHLKPPHSKFILVIGELNCGRRGKGGEGGDVTKLSLVETKAPACLILSNATGTSSLLQLLTPSART